ncbi:hypothetical protein COCC4DRAFT_57324 [Bipolaris maydis ATCC 48331]|uniref:LIM zinc-binding domain-containing protein n=2 Tax=Cochliobolus heterostrophus TaxID=5016 RepID=M2UUY0_COCH5|nr:uncharacterized protein COCC4DRAFT_57324 [Bipolaris maydis ATCC 48331]EMD91657.1 hypothetical protein COCHEDRAFT_1194411 [Bipolaris maydis C5]KAJ5027190.1 hypothetical protein J3E73DRAFT_431189 [Bipolaris maydis]ENI08586.1 hypothetical protein COCC4DRAFT_57324 [Bipolaris maydis ATCC 48331]KAJ6209025.1 hypothetical protein PSV09DRAFT_1194411 [Bipolaris maydis]KAJ6270909.1 hypothetical protein PSV08DRAFT_223730 [Bipolaris maydis]
MFASKEREGASSPGPGAYYSQSQMKNYLQDLRTNRPARPTGARPAPAHFNTWSSRTPNRNSDSSAVAALQRTFTDPAVDADAQPSAPQEPGSHNRAASRTSIEKAGGPGRPLVQAPRGRETSRSSSHTRTPSMIYRERQERQVEQDEARAIRAAMEDLELATEGKIYEAARDEAAELVWKHRNPNAAENNPHAPYSYPGLGRKNSTQRSRSVEAKDQDLQRANSKLRKRHSMGSAASGSRSSSLQSNGPGGNTDVSTTGNETSATSPTKGCFDLKGKKYESPALAKAISDLPDFKQRRRSSGSRRTASGSLFQNPNDQIYEEPEEETSRAPRPKPAPEPSKTEKLPLGVRRNPFMRFQSIKSNPLVRSSTDPTMASKRLDRYEIQKNPPSQSRNAGYTLNSTVSKPSDKDKANAENMPEVKMKDGKEIRSEELRAATGFRLKDRSPKLPTPTAVSDAPGRPIVSFKKDWNVVELKEVASTLSDPAPVSSNQPKSGQPPLVHAATAPDAPTISLAPDVPKRSTTPIPPLVPEIKIPEPSNGLAPEIPKRSTAPRPPETPAINVSSSNATSALRGGKFDRPAISVREDPPAPARPLPLTSSLRKAQIPTRPSVAPIPTIHVPDSSPAHSRTTSTPSVPSISVSETPSSRSYHRPSSSVTAPVPSISVSNSPSFGRGSSSASRSMTPGIPSISVSESSAPKRGSRGSAQPIPSISVSETPVPRRGSTAPSINVTPDVPTISVNQSPASIRGRHSNVPSISVNPSVPSINVNTTKGFGPAASTRPLPVPGAQNKSHTYSGSGSGRTHWTPTTVRTGALCTQCALPIAGRIVSAGGSRFHPECFTCYQCGEHLECVAFYPEPSNKHAERVQRIRARLTGFDIPFLPSHPTAEDMARLEHDDGTDESPRFYCHLDFHELFSPRCKSCKTPIEGEVIVACGAEWHAGHFFCAQCGDPFDSTTPFVEKDGYAWCVNCHTHRYSTKCKGCRKPVTDTVVKALGAEWHTNCFVCVICSGPFEDGRYFLRGDTQDPVCVRCEERRLKA